jgi:hypothetical protein
MKYLLSAKQIELASDNDPSKRWKSSWLEVTDPSAPVRQTKFLSDVCIPKFQMMCEAIMGDIQHPEGSGAGTLKAIQDVESGRLPEEELGGNAWTTLITPSKVWFEGHYSQGEGGEVSLAQYKLAVQTYVQFLFDPERKPIEVPFPAD